VLKLLTLLLVSTGLSAATLIGVNHPIYFFDVGNEIFICKHNQSGVICLGRDKKTGIKVRYECTAVVESEGYLKDCHTKKTISYSI